MAAGDPTPPTRDGRPVDRDKIASIGIRPTDRTGTTRTKRDELGNAITHHWSDDARQDVTVRPRTLGVGISVQEQ